MIYKYCENGNFEDFASGRVIAHRAGYPNFPVRLAQEIFGRCLSYLGRSDHICLYDPCCGGGYLLTILGFLHYGRIETIMASDINDDAIQLARENLSLLEIKGLEERIQKLDHLWSLYNKPSHREALDSASHLLDILTNATHEIKREAFLADLLLKGSLDSRDFKADIILTDVPYGNLVRWQNGNTESVNLLEQLLPVTKAGTVVAICSDKSQKFQSDHFQRVDKQTVGKRLFQIYKKVEGKTE